MDRIRIQGGVPLRGKIKISGAKNAALPLMTAALLTDKPLVLENIPHLKDISTMANVLSVLGADISLLGHAPEGYAGEVMSIHAPQIAQNEAPYDLVRQMRASMLVLGPLLARHGEAKVSLPGGCAIGSRPVDLHIMGFEKMGAEVEITSGYICARVKGRLKGAEITFPKVSVGATENVMMAATLAEGTTVMHGAAQEPEIIDLAHCLMAMGAKITGAGSPTITIEGVERLEGATHKVMPDRIEAGTYAVAAAITGGDVILEGLNPEYMESFFAALEEAGVTIEAMDNAVRVWADRKTLRAVNVETCPYPGFPTDLQAQFMTLMTVANGSSTIVEGIFENRFMHVPELSRMGADIDIKGTTAHIHGTASLKGAEVMATDLRASVSLVLAGLMAKGETMVHRVYHLDRGYERLEEKLHMCGAQIERVRDV